MRLHFKLTFDGREGGMNGSDEFQLKRHRKKVQIDSW